MSDNLLAHQFNCMSTETGIKSQNDNLYRNKKQRV